MADSERTTAPDRRSVFKSILAAASIAPVAAAAVATASSPIRQMIAEYQAAAEALDKAMSAADKALFAAFPDPMTRPGEDDEKPAHIRLLYDEAERLYWVMNAAYDRVIGTPCRSLGDCIAVLEWGVDDDVVTVVDAVLPCLRRLAGAA